MIPTNKEYVPIEVHLGTNPYLSGTEGIVGRTERTEMTRNTGRCDRIVAGGKDVQAFVPFPLPPEGPPLIIDGPLAAKLRTAEDALARLDLAREIVPSLDWFLNVSVRKEAVLSSQIEGKQATLMDVLTVEAERDPTPNPDVEEICNYVEALRYARAELGKPDGLPLSMRLLDQAHRRLMRGVRGARHQPGQVRRSQTWIGATRPGDAVQFPAPVSLLPELLTDFEKYLHAEDDLPALVRAGLAHVHFETIHPYLDQNGRIGRLLIALLLEHWGLLKAPLLYLSLFFKGHRAEYLRRLNAVQSDGDWEGWTDFFLRGVATIADDATASAHRLLGLVAHDRDQVLSQRTYSVSAARLFELLPTHPILTVTNATGLMGTTKPTATRAIKTLEAAGVLVETTGRKRDRRFAYDAYLARICASTELKPKRSESRNPMSSGHDAAVSTTHASTKIQYTTSFNGRTATIATSDCIGFLEGIDDESIDLVVTSPPYFIGKEYDNSTEVSDFERTIGALISSVQRVLKASGSLCWQVGNHVRRNRMLPLDYAVARAMAPHTSFILRNRIIWTFSHGTHLKRRFSGRHETILWYTKGEDYLFDLDATRVPQKYPGKKHYKGPNKGEFSGNPLGKNPGDFWASGAVWDIPNVKANHVEKTDHPCQFPIALARRLVVALSPAAGTVLDPFLGSGTTAIAALLDGRNFLGCDVSQRYISLAKSRLQTLVGGSLRYRQDVPVQIPRPNEAVALPPPHFRIR